MLRSSAHLYYLILNFKRLIGAVAQLGERLPCTQEVSGSIPLSSTKYWFLYPLLILKKQHLRILMWRTQPVRGKARVRSSLKR